MKVSSPLKWFPERLIGAGLQTTIALVYPLTYTRRIRLRYSKQRRWIFTVRSYHYHARCPRGLDPQRVLVEENRALHERNRALE